MHADLRDLQNAELDATSGGACYGNVITTDVGNKGVLTIGWVNCGTGYFLPYTRWEPSN